jgi:murein L,D-transpeptidase YcbB/YkuD
MPILRRSSQRPLILRIPSWLPHLLIAVFFFPSLAPAAPLSLQVAGEIRSVLDREGIPRLVLDREMLLNADLLPGFYRSREYFPAWVDDFGMTAAGGHLLDLLRSADEHGLCPEDYHLTRIEAVVELAADYRRYGILFDPVYMARLDLLLTDAFLLYAAHLVEGRVDPDEVHEGWRARPRKVDLVWLLSNALTGDRVVPVLADIAPPHPGYLLLREELERYRRISALGGWPGVPAGPVLRAGDTDPRLPWLRLRLLASNDLLEHEVAGGELFDKETAAALVRFQQRHGLHGDGVLGPKTLAALNVSVEARIRQIELNLERWRWLPKDLGDRCVVVNIADFQLAVMEGTQTVMTMPVVVGTAYRKTPVFSARMSHLIFAPYWNVPKTILREDKLPLIKANPGFLREHHFEMVRGEGENMVEVDPASIRWAQMKAENFPGVLRQKPGPWNPLGRVKFMLPNPFDVYLHDTPDKRLFGRDARTFSSGCIRLERPVELATHLLGDSGWSRQMVLEAMAASEPLRVSLGKPLPVHILYWTAWVDEEGRLQFRDDIYLRDLDLDRALNRRRAEPGRLPQSSLPQGLTTGG